jgi:hypothetical protein
MMTPLGPPGKRARKHRTSRKRSADTAACSLRPPARPARRPLRDRDVVSARPPRARRTSPSSSASSRVGSWAGAGAARYARTSRWTRSSRRSMRDGLTSRCCTIPTAARKVDSIGRRNTHEEVLRSRSRGVRDARLGRGFPPTTSSLTRAGSASSGGSRSRMIRLKRWNERRRYRSSVTRRSRCVAASFDARDLCSAPGYNRQTLAPHAAIRGVGALLHRKPAERDLARRRHKDRGVCNVSHRYAVPAGRKICELQKRLARPTTDWGLPQTEDDGQSLIFQTWIKRAQVSRRWRRNDDRTNSCSVQMTNEIGLI